MPPLSDGNFTTVESLRDSAELLSTTVSSLLDMVLKKEPITGLSRTPGEHHGESLVTSESRETWTKRELVSVVFNLNHLIQSTDEFIH